MLLGWSHVQTSPVYIWAPLVGAGAVVVVAHPASRRRIAAVARAFITHLRWSVDWRSDDCGGQNIQMRCQDGAPRVSASRGPPTGKRTTEKWWRALTTPSPTRITEGDERRGNERHRGGDPHGLRARWHHAGPAGHVWHVLPPALRRLRQDGGQRRRPPAARHGRGAGRAAVRPLRHRGARLPVRAPAAGHPRSRRRAVGGGPAPLRRSGVSERVTGDMTEIDEAEARGRTELWPFWRRVYAQGDPLPRFAPPANRAPHRFDEGDPLPEEYRSLLLKMLRHEGERAGNKSFLGFMATCLDLAEAIFPDATSKLIKAEYLAEELKHAIMFHRLAVGLERDFALKDVPYAHYAFHLPRETWADDALFHFFVDLNGAFHARDWRESSYVPLAKMSATVERDELGHSEMGYRFLGEIVSDARGRALAQRLLAKWYPAALDMFGRSDSKNAPKFLRWGLKSVGNAEIRAAYKTYVDAKVVALGLEPPDERANRRFL